MHMKVSIWISHLTICIHSSTAQTYIETSKVSLAGSCKGIYISDGKRTCKRKKKSLSLIVSHYTLFFMAYLFIYLWRYIYCLGYVATKKMWEEDSMMNRKKYSCHLLRITKKNHKIRQPRKAVHFSAFKICNPLIRARRFITMTPVRSHLLAINGRITVPTCAPIFVGFETTLWFFQFVPPNGALPTLNNTSSWRITQIHGCWERHKKLLSVSLQGWDHMRDLGTDKRIILKHLLKMCASQFTGFY